MIRLYEFVKILQKNLSVLSGCGSGSLALHKIREALLRLQLAHTSEERLELFVEGLQAQGFAHSTLVQLYDAVDLLRPNQGQVPWLQQVEGACIRFCFWGEALYPQAWLHLDDAPLAFTFFGSPLWQTREALSVVGSREPHAFSQQWMQTELRRFLGEHKGPRFFTLSGGARGVDQWVHRLSQAMGVPTLAILPSGLLQPYPQNFASLGAEILAEGGCVLSEYSLTQDLRKFHFSERNRLITAMGEATLVVEAGAKSGSLMSGHLALEQGRPLYVVPGHPAMPSFRGSLELLRLGAACAASAEDLHVFWRCDSSSSKSFCNKL